MSTKNLTLQKVINLLINLTQSTENVDYLQQKFVDLLTQELNVYCCLIQSFEDNNLNCVSNFAQVNQAYTIVLKLANLIINQEKFYLEQGQYLIKSSADYRSEAELDFPIFSIFIFPLKYKQKYLGNLFLYQTHHNYQWQLSEIELIKLVSLHLAIIIDQAQLEKENFFLKQEEKLMLKTAYISHELRTPISAIVGFSKMMLKEIYGTLNSKQKDYITRITNSGEYLLTLVNDLLDLVKLNQQKEELFLTNIKIESLCEQAIIMIEEQAKIKGLNLLVLINTSAKTIVGDQRRLTQILINLLSNSVKFTEQGSITLKVNSDNNQLMFSVIDTGIGIKKEEQDQLFKPFQQLSNHLHQNLNPSEKGTGLGLALSQQLAYLHGGKITCHSEVNRGSCFTLYLPLKEI